MKSNLFFHKANQINYDYGLFGQILLCITYYVISSAGWCSVFVIIIFLLIIIIFFFTHHGAGC